MGIAPSVWVQVSTFSHYSVLPLNVLWGSRLAPVYNISPHTPLNPHIEAKKQLLFIITFTLLLFLNSAHFSHNYPVSEDLHLETLIQSFSPRWRTEWRNNQIAVLGREEERLYTYFCFHLVTGFLFLLIALPSKQCPPGAQSPYSCCGLCCGHLWQCHAAPDVWEPHCLSTPCQYQSNWTLHKYFFREFERLC